MIHSAAMTARPAQSSDAIAIAALHAESWRSTYRGILRDDFLDGPALEDRCRFWTTRLAHPPETQFVRLIEEGDEVRAFACTLLDVDPEWGALLDNLHVSPSSKGCGLGRRLLADSAVWVLQHRPQSRLHLWVYEQNRAACGFYEQVGGEVTTREVHQAPDGSLVRAVCYGWKTLRDLIPTVR
jgi:ribosomal protein S18 acetylase RimI-like enzyme